MNDQPRRRLTKIVCTVGPASKTEEHIAALMNAGMSVARINLSHGTAEEQLPLIRRLKKVREQMPSQLGILLDISGAQIRTGEVAFPIVVRKGEEVLFASENTVIPEGKTAIRINYAAFSDDVRETDRILLDNGELSFDLLDVLPSGIVLAKAREDGSIGSRRHVNLPGADIDLPTFTERDWKDIEVAIAEEVEFIGLSFVRSAADVEEAKSFLRKRNSTMQCIAKIETRQAVEAIASVIDAADGIMVARGDLGAEVPFEDLPVIQDDIVLRCRNAGKPVIVATHMLESMTQHPLPTRAEVTDVSHAARIQTDTTMLSEETAVGKHPLLAVDAMHRILLATERHMERFSLHATAVASNDREARAEAAVTLAHAENASAIVVMTQTGDSARAVAKFRPMVPIIAVTDNPVVARHLTLSYGVFPIVTSFEGEFEDSVRRGFAIAQNHELVHSGTQIVLLTGSLIQDGSTVISVQTRKVV